MRRSTTRFIYKFSEIKARYDELTLSIPAHRIYYSVKSNPHPKILKFISQLGLEAEVSSLGELNAAINAGFEAANIVYGGPGKTIGDIYSATEKGVIYFSLESISELEKICFVEKSTGKNLNRILRLLVLDNNGRLNMMTPNSKFGITLDEVREYVGNGDGSVYGIHIYSGTQIKESEFRASIIKTNEIVSEIESIIGYKLKYVNYGGGLEWPFMHSGKPILTPDKIEDILSGIESCFEFGRYLVASCGILETEILDIKKRNNYQILIVSAGINIINGISASGRLIRQQPEFHPPNNKSDDIMLPTAIYGPLCTPVDYLTLNTLLPRLYPGDVLTIYNCGAYAANTGLSNFLIREPAQEVFIE
ncbi:hypothetical protein KKI90_11605 [Xenorhabdus bovienii]|uniref:hypothetical protein n=1 Tax=Xenorhabdus bovienii TaxID=40576 RepID=UPI00237D251E|nr:hypothetical protein [Xenorhabdus bovienii]MDE1487097.1 hypothetical protein [Xenorhabdus bovienii]MDE9477865.1 hypothetical protein [Xenorhabdus bovienii]MDE9530756.1 hypothetical protein [Xenorhabdus bovienii]